MLILEVVSPPAAGGVSRHTFHDDGGTIGRESDNAWVLPHGKVSSRHAVITCRDSVFYIEDRSRNGVCINSSRNRLERGRPYALRQGDHILIEPYEISVTISSDQSQRAPDRGRANPFDADDPFAASPLDALAPGVSTDDLPSAALDPLELLNLTPKRAAPPRKVPTSDDLRLGSALDGHYQPPAAVPVSGPAPPPDSSSMIPEGWDPLAPDEPPPVAVPRPSPGRPVEPRHEPRYEPRIEPQAAPRIEPRAEPRVAPRPEPPIEPHPAPRVEPREPLPPPAAAVHRAPQLEGPPAAAAPAPSNEGAAPSAHVDFAAVLVGAGLDPSAITADTARDFGRILRVVVAGVMDVMRAREQIKDEFRMQVTRVRPIENNPLKFSADVDDALHNLLMKRNRAYLGPVEAFDDAFADLRHHQIAMLAGMRVAFESMLAEFDPDRLQQEFDRQSSKGLVPAKLRYWDLYREKRQEWAKDAETTFRRLFGAEFARAYEDEMRELRARERKTERPPATPPSDSDV